MEIQPYFSFRVVHHAVPMEVVPFVPVLHVNVFHLMLKSILRMENQ